ncbi:hypothetical protein T552_00123 [Pneumocystis carinii B80]|uniref:Zinc finger PHD-type domain-containing protein n=1 Tax=Pneumocystis carinii (strain B80) TaxID=1408658 RepID=A0A0W4ZSX6_PNEC8|nr:hypothetical protein T552_00123 [Pneumocystis carinii B80]KTW31480.1 hypothetical protein T552_00123 [Pneumocystis carinii B80]
MDIDDAKVDDYSSKQEENVVKVLDYEKNESEASHLNHTNNMLNDKKGDEIQAEYIDTSVSRTSFINKKDIKKERTKKRKINGLNIEGSNISELENDCKSDVFLNNMIKKPHINNFNNIKNENVVLYCICQKPDTGCWMIACDGCDNWYHGECVKIVEADEELLDKYFCDFCTKKGKGCTMWKRKCRLSSCRKPALVSSLPPSKYCSIEHGIEYFKERLCCSLLEKSEIAALARSVDSVEAFRCLGDTFPFIDDSVVNSESLSLLRLINFKREKIYERLKQIEIRTIYINFAKDRAKKINEEIRADGSKKEICALDYRLSWDEDEWNAWIVSDDGKKIFNDGKLEGYDMICITEKRKCFKHNNWVMIKIEEMELEDIICRETLKKLRRQEQKIYKRERKLKILDKENKCIAIT